MATETPPNSKNAFLFFVTLAVAVSIVCLGVVVFAARMP